MAVRAGGPLRRALIFHIPLAVIVVATLFPFYWMAVTAIRPDTELYSVKVNPFFTFHPTLNHFRDLFDAHDVRTLGVEHVLHRHGRRRGCPCSAGSWPDTPSPAFSSAGRRRSGR